MVAVVVLRRIGGEDAFAHRRAQDLAQWDQAVVQRLAADLARGTLVGEVGLDPRAGDLPQSQIAEGRFQALSEMNLVVVVGRCLDPGLLLREFEVVLRPEPEGGFSVSVPALPGCNTQGETWEEALATVREAIEGCIESLVAQGDPIPGPMIPPARLDLGVCDDFR